MYLRLTLQHPGDSNLNPPLKKQNKNKFSSQSMRITSYQQELRMMYRVSLRGRLFLCGSLSVPSGLFLPGRAVELKLGEGHTEIGTRSAAFPGAPGHTLHPGPPGMEAGAEGHTLILLFVSQWLPVPPLVPRGLGLSKELECSSQRQ